VAVLGEKPLGVFVRSLLGLDIQAAKAAFSELMNGVQLTYAQSTFLNTIINYLNQNGTIDSSLLYQSPFTDIDVEGVTGVFDEEKAVRIIQIINKVNNNALAG
jgi:type I restriction enzyme R subunit